MTNTELTKEQKTEVACKMVLMDAMEKGHTNKADLINYMRSKTFEDAVKSYIEMM